MRVDAKCLGLLAGALLSTAAVPALAADQQQGVNVEQLQQRVQRLENIIDSGQIAQLIQKINSLQQNLRDLRGQIETQSHRLDELRKRQRNLYSDLDRRLRDLEVAQKNQPAQSGGGTSGESGGSGGSSAAAGAAADASGAASGGGGSSSASGGGGSGSAQGNGDSTAAQGNNNSAEAERKDYDAAFELLKDGRYDDAAQAFRTFLQNHPKGPYADNAQYWLGESYYVTREFDKALAAFRGVAQKYPDSAKLPDARLKAGYTLYELGHMDEAKSTLQKVIRDYPDSSVSRLAQDRLVRIKHEEQNSGSDSGSSGN